MFGIVDAVEHIDGIEVVYRRDGEERRRVFSQDDLITMGINPLDLLQAPEGFAIDPERGVVTEKMLS
ncbi:hypothetical protein [Methanofollis fontis]|uniref:Uncharacterized protein n=1 Tax=Methanofollis fontis TaxID=2052832 RepID=A0A483CU56_9EURY|nr:hypothetical protein [Methanofollis fontis]TAJ44983.1 hypothetical protein CUJ86_06815 [Methanofollis fontis]